MADNVNIVNLVTDIFNPDAVTALKDNLGIDIFSGQTTFTGDLTGSGWLGVAAINSLENNDVNFTEDNILNTFNDIVSSKNTKGDILKFQANNKGDNLTTQLIMYVKNSSAELSTALTLLKKVFTNESSTSILKNQLKNTNSSGISAAMIISGDLKLIKGAVNENLFKDYAEAFYDTSYSNNTNLLPLGKLLLTYASADDDGKTIISNALKQILGITDSNSSIEKTSKWDAFNKIFNPFSKATTVASNNSITDFIYLLGDSNLEKIFSTISSDANHPFNIIFSNLVKENIDSSKAITDCLEVIVNSTAIKSCVGIKMGETGFDLNTYKTLITDYEPVINVLYNLIKKLGENTKFDSKFFFNHLSPFLFPIPDKKNVEGYTLLSLMCENLVITETGIKETNLSPITTVLLQEIAATVNKNAPSDASVLKKFFIFNAYSGNCRDFSNSATMNLYGPVNLILDKINQIQQTWCSNNNKNFDDFKDTYTNIIINIFTKDYSDMFDFDISYKYWCKEYDKLF